MRHMISGLVAAIAVVVASAAPAMACGGGACSPCGQSYGIACAPPQVYVAPAPVYDTGCSSCGWAAQRLPDPVHQYYHVNQGPTYGGPGNFAPYPTYQESAVSGWDAYRRRPYYYGYDGGRYANAVNHQYDGAPNVEGPAIYSYRARPHVRPYYHSPRMNYRYGYAPRHSHHSMHYAPAPYHYGHRVLRRYY